MYAILRTGGKQYTVKENDVISIDKLGIEAGETVVLSDVLFVNTDNGPVVGAPVVEGASVTAKVLGETKSKKIIGRTYKPRKSTSRRFGHRQQYSRVLIEKIALGK
ncbi:MAG: 50S ribosomal protein L21 [Armatimonadota bacterium]|jgi:large subunit ribosomal protein L21|nr:50S ribosomal protein L21 [Armatimonadota bacterium]